MLIPIGDDNVEGGFKPVFTYLFLAINIIVFIYSASNLQYMADTFGANPCDILNGRDWVNLLTSMFMHGGLGHLVGNMLFLWIFADNIESTIGNKQFLGFYLLGGLCAAALHILASASNCNLTNGLPMVGASGAIAAVMGAYIVMFPRSKIKMLFFIKVFYLPAYIFLGFWIGNQLLSFYGSGLFQPKAGGGVAFGAHIGGFIFGALAGLYFKRKYPKIIEVVEPITHRHKEYKSVKVTPKRYNNRFVK